MALGDSIKNVLANTFTKVKKVKNPNYVAISDKKANNSTIRTNEGEPDQDKPKEKKNSVTPSVLNADYKVENDSIYNQPNPQPVNANEQPVIERTPEPVKNDIKSEDNEEIKQTIPNNQEEQSSEQQNVGLNQTFNAPTQSLTQEFNIPTQSEEDNNILSSLIEPPSSFLASQKQEEETKEEEKTKKEENNREITIGEGNKNDQSNEPQVSFPNYSQNTQPTISNPRLDENNANFYDRFDKLIGSSTLKGQLSVDNYLDSLQDRIRNNPNDINAARQYVFAVRNRDKIQQEIERINEIDDDRSAFFNSKDFINPLWEILENSNPITVDDLNNYFNTTFNKFYGYNNDEYSGNNGVLFQRDNINPNIFYYNPDGTLNKNKTMSNLIQHYGMENILNFLIHRDTPTGEGRIDLNPANEENSTPSVNNDINNSINFANRLSEDIWDII